MINNEWSNKDSYVVPEQSPLIILYSKTDVCMDNNDKDTKHTRKFSRRVHFVINGEDWNINEKMWCEGGLQLADIETKKGREDELNLRLV